MLLVKKSKRKKKNGGFFIYEYNSRNSSLLTRRFMLSLQFIRDNPDIVRAAIKNKSTKIDFDAFLVLDEKKKTLQQEVETLRAKRNELSASMGK